MAKIVFIAHGLTSPLNTSLELSRRLEAAGHRVTYASHADIGDSVAAAGFGFVRLNEDPAVEQPPALRFNVFGWISAMRRVRIRIRRVRGILVSPPFGKKCGASFFCKICSSVKNATVIVIRPVLILRYSER